MIEGSECECGKKVVPSRNLCPKCGKNMIKTEFEEKGSVLTHTTLYAVPEGFEAPIKLAMIEIENGADLICSYEGKEDLNIGAKVKIKKKGKLYICELIK
jgi:uncharacterized OB-fold protein